MWFPQRIKLLSKKLAIDVEVLGDWDHQRSMTRLSTGDV